MMSRRSSIIAGTATALGAGSAMAAVDLNLDDPKTVARTRAKIMGSTVEEPVYTYISGSIFTATATTAIWCRSTP